MSPDASFGLTGRAVKDVLLFSRRPGDVSDNECYRASDQRRSQPGEATKTGSPLGAAGAKRCYRQRATVARERTPLERVGGGFGLQRTSMSRRCARNLWL
jgi:hypothetical protein